MMENAPDLLVKPVTESQRLKLIDALRGIALLGILLMNIPVFAMPSYFSESFKNDPTNINFWVDAVISVVFEGKMRALFGMIVYLLREVRGRRDAGRPAFSSRPERPWRRASSSNTAEGGRSL